LDGPVLFNALDLAGPHHLNQPGEPNQKAHCLWRFRRQRCL